MLSVTFAVVVFIL